MLLATASPAASAEEPAVPPLVPPAETLVSRLGRPARLDRALELVRESLGATEEDQLRVAEALSHAGGAAAACGLEALLGSRSPGVRTRVFAAVVHVGLRSARIAKAARWSLASTSEEERLAALEALGVAGDGRDLRTLLDQAAAGASPARRAAFRALRTLTGTDIPYDAHRWEVFTAKLEKRADAELARAVAAVEEAPDVTAARVHAESLGRLGWVRLERVEHVLDRWFVDPNPILRAAACLVTDALRLADRTDDVEAVREFATPDGELANLAARALERLGVHRVAD
jgi:hypothetical protein